MVRLIMAGTSDKIKTPKRSDSFAAARGNLEVRSEIAGNDVRFPRMMKTLAIVAMGSCLAGWAGALPAGATENEVLTTVHSSVYNGYARAKLPDGTFKPQTYVFGQGQYMSGQMHDPSIEGFPFLRLAQLLAPFLARQNYLPARSPDQTDLIIVVHWGTTIPYDDGTYRTAVDGLQTAMSAAQTFGAPAGGQMSGGPMQALQAQQSNDLTSALMMVEMENRQRDRANAHNAALLGYLPEMNRIGDFASFSGLRTYYSDLVSDVEEDRYFVILAAYDFPAARKEKKRRLLWITRVSVSVRGNRFDDELAAMLLSASRYFGENSPGLMRQSVPEGRVDVGEPKVIGVVPDAGR
jgi:hypothetical protein